MLLLYRMCLFYSRTLTNDLHSTMLLLYLQVPSLFIRAYQIYIPLCFYFIIYVQNHPLRIPHLHSTMLLLYPLGCRVDIQHKLNLHSTMLLLYRWTAYEPEGESWNLHSTMLLLYLDENMNKISVALFTFHYASTLSQINCLSCFYNSIYIPLCFYFIIKRPARSKR